MPIIPPSGGQQLTAQEAAGIHNANITEEDYPIKTSQFTDTLAGYAPLEALADYASLEALADYLKEADTYFKSPTEQSQVDYTSIANVQNKVIAKYVPTVSHLAGNYSISLDNIYTPINLIGDTRVLAGHTWTHGIAVLSTVAKAGSGVISLSRYGKEITITGASTNPDLSDFGAGDFVLIAHALNLANCAKYEIASISGTNTIVLTEKAPTVNVAGVSLCLIPNRKITNNLVINSGQVTLQGFYMDSLTGTSLEVNNIGTKCTLKNFVVFNSVTDGSNYGIGLHARFGGTIETGNREVSIFKAELWNIATTLGGFLNVPYISCISANENWNIGPASIDRGALVTGNGGSINAQYGRFIYGSCGINFYGSEMNCSYSYSWRNRDVGYKGMGPGILYCLYSSAKYNGSVGFQNNYGALVYAAGSSTYTSDNAGNYGSGTGGGNIIWS